MTDSPVNQVPDLDPDGTRLPVKVDTATNGEYMPRPLTAAARHANARAHELADHARRHIFGLIGARAYGLKVREIKKTQADVSLRGIKQASRERPSPSIRTCGPKSRRAFLELNRGSGGRPG